ERARVSDEQVPSPLRLPVAMEQQRELDPDLLVPRALRDGRRQDVDRFLGPPDVAEEGRQMRIGDAHPGLAADEIAKEPDRLVHVPASKGREGAVDRRLEL